jgi:hypothetical protein
MATLPIPTLTIRVTAPAAPPAPPPPPPPGLEGYTAVDPAAEVTVTFGDFTATIGDVTGHGVYADGMPYVCVAPGGTLTMTAKTPPVETSGRIRHGFTLNPTIDPSYYPDNIAGYPETFRHPGNQAFDSQAKLSAQDWRNGFVASALPALPLTLEEGDVLLFGVAAETSGASTSSLYRDGFLTNQAWLHVRVGEAPAGAFSPPMFWPGRDKKHRPVRVPDVTTMLSWLPALATAGMTRPVTWAQVASVLDRPAATRVATLAATASDGYEVWSPRGWTLAPGSNYDAYPHAALDLAMMGLIGNSWSAADKELCLRRLLQHGCQWFEAIMRHGFAWRSDGGHFMTCAVPALLWAFATDQQHLLRPWGETYGPGNHPGQFVAMTAEVLTDVTTPHDSDGLPYISRRRTISAVSGNTITVNQYGSDIGHLWGLRLIRESGGTAHILGSSYSGSAYTLTIDAQPSPPFAVNDVVYAAALSSRQVGDPDWIEKGVWQDYRYFNAGAGGSYRYTNVPGGTALFLAALQIVPPLGGYPAMLDYAERTAAQTYPEVGKRVFDPPFMTQYTLPLVGSNTDWQNHWTAQMFNTHFATVKPDMSARATGTALTIGSLDQWVDLDAADVLFEEWAGQAPATPATVGGPVGTVRNLGTRGGYWRAPDASTRPTLRETGGKKYLEFEGAQRLQWLGYPMLLACGYHVFLDVEERSTGGGTIWAVMGNSLSTRNSARLTFGSSSQHYYFTHGNVDTAGTAIVSVSGSGLAPRQLVEPVFVRGSKFLTEKTTAVRLFVDGVQAGTDQPFTQTWQQYISSQNTYRGMVLGYHDHFPGPQDHARMNFYGMAMYHSGQLSSAEVAAIRTAMG